MKEKDVKKKNFLYAIMHAIFDLLYKLPSACHFIQLSVSSFDLLCTGQSTKAKFEPKISAFHYFLFSSSQVFVKQTYNTTKGHYKFIEKSCLFIHMWQSHTKHYFMVHVFQYFPPLICLDQTMPNDNLVCVALLPPALCYPISFVASFITTMEKIHLARKSTHLRLNTTSIHKTSKTHKPACHQNLLQFSHYRH